ncbi:MAG: disulfide bond formation protein B [Proteobacteria bacterium]|nr:disulfide bond formation protein B [Pseudomonadota bacterium]MBU1709987.1 disulfide bond formation protein B [Pseudomonadota bacterium]
MTHTDQPSNSNWTILFLCWLLAAVSALGSIFFSHFMELPPCVLCWYQRICLFPLVLILPFGLFPFEKNVVKYTLPLAGAGWCIALYHNLLFYGVIPESIQPCQQGVSCTDDLLNLFGFVTIPLLSFLSFSVILGLLIMLKRRTTS